MQFDRMAGKVIGSEDCLYLNIYRPAVRNKISDLLRSHKYFSYLKIDKIMQIWTILTMQKIMTNTT